jgi:hypothetical protein
MKISNVQCSMFKVQCSILTAVGFEHSSLSIEHCDQLPLQECRA